MSQGAKTTENTAVNRLIELAQGNGKPLEVDEDLFLDATARAARDAAKRAVAQAPQQPPPPKAVGKAPTSGKQIPPPFRNTGITAVVPPLPRPSGGFPVATPAPELRAEPSTGPLELSEIEEVSPSPPAQAARLAPLPMTPAEQSWYDPTESVGKYDDDVAYVGGTQSVVKQRGGNTVWYVAGAFGLGLGLAALFFWPGDASTPKPAAQPAALAAGVMPAAEEQPPPPPAPVVAPIVTPAPAPLVEPVPLPEAAPVVEAVPEPAPPPEPVNPTVRFESSPAGAKVVLVVDGDMIQLGLAPVERQLDLGRKYEVMYTLEGHASLIVPVEGGTAERVAASMGATTSTATIVKVAAAPAAVAEVEEPAPAPVEVVAPAPKAAPKKATTPKAAPKKVAKAEPAPKKKAATSGGSGTLKIGAKPPCDVFVDGKKVGTSPIANLAVSPGKHKLTLVNREYGIKETVNVTVAAGETVKVVKDLTRKMK